MATGEAFWDEIRSFAQLVKAERGKETGQLHQILEVFRRMPHDERKTALHDFDSVLSELTSLRALLRVIMASRE